MLLAGAAQHFRFCRGSYVIQIQYDEKNDSIGSSATVLDMSGGKRLRCSYCGVRDECSEINFLSVRDNFS